MNNKTTCFCMFMYLICQTCSSFVLQYLTMMVCPGLTTLSSAKLWRISLTAFSHRELPAAGSSPPRRSSCLLSCSSSPRSAPVSVRPVEEYTKMDQLHIWYMLDVLSHVQLKESFTEQAPIKQTRP